MSTENQNEVIDLTPKQIKDKSVHKLTNADISANYLKDRFHLMLNDFRGSFACWVVRQLEVPNYELIANSIKAYSDYLSKKYFKTKDTVIEMDCEMLNKLTHEDLFIAIPEIYALNEVGTGFVDLGALSRNVFYDILRNQITQPL
jgi:hypothetical protein